MYALKVLSEEGLNPRFDGAFLNRTSIDDDAEVIKVLIPDLMGLF